jgi:UDP-N-acetylmuramate dehydrogenase
VDLSRFSSIKIGPTVEIDIIDKKEPIGDRFLIGGANNILFSNRPPKLAMLSKRFEYIEIVDGYLKVGAFTKSGKVFSFCKKHNIGGLEYLGKLPGTLGGLLKMNAGMKSYEIFNNLVKVEFLEGYRYRDEIEFGYRYTNIDEPVYEAIFDINHEFDSSLVDEFSIMRSNQPRDPSAGSAFKNPPNDSAGRLIEAVGLKGICRGGASWSSIHANFLVNLGSARYEDAIFLIEEAKRRVYEEFGVLLEEEIIIL